MLESDSYGNLPASLSWSPHEILTPRSPSAAAAGLQCQSSCSNSCVTGVVRSMEDTSCDTSFAVDCTLSLGTAASRPDIPAQLSRSGSPALDPAWQRCSTSEQVDAATLRTHVEDRSEQVISWTSSSGCSNPNLLQEFYPQASVSRRGSRPGNSFQRRPWRTFSAKASEKKVVPCAGLMGMQESHSYDSIPARRSWLPSSSASAKPSASGGNSVPPGCLQESNSEGRVCAHCGTTKTPLWRNGPQGPKSLCNACGIRHKKAGRRSAAASVSPDLPGCQSGTAVAVKGGKHKLGEELGHRYWMYQGDSQPRKQRRNIFLRPSDSLLSGASCMTWQPSLLAPTPQASLKHECHSALPCTEEEVMVPMNAFATDEEEGAVLLMALSYGTVHA